MSDSESRSFRNALPTRIITYAWGETYIDELLSLTLPALLAPGNLPRVAAEVPCELVLLTEERFFARVLNHRSIGKARALCPLRLVGLDDLVTSKDAYGMSLTHALHRGFSDLGAEATNTWLIFLNADFILADNSLDRLLGHLRRGERIVASPSYCVNSSDVAPQLLAAVDVETGALSLSHRRMASLILHHRHNTVRAKTVNQSDFHHRYMDQFYWDVDSHTLIGHQMPIAIVGLRPERQLVEPNSFWDHGLIAEFCPESPVTVLGDSDEFLMLELRRNHAELDLLESGPLDPAEVGARMISRVTPYQRDFAAHQLTLHDQDLPAEIDDARRKLEAFVGNVLCHCPAVLPSHLDHPQWNYHRPRFIEGRHAVLSKQLGSLTETGQPPASLSELDRAWWLLDGAEKSHARNRGRVVEALDCQREILTKRLVELKEGLATRRREVTERSLAELGASANRDFSSQSVFFDLHFDRSSPNRTNPASPAAGDLSAVYQRWIEEITSLDRSDSVEETRINALIQTMTRLGQQHLQRLDGEFETAKAELHRRYHALLPRRTASATIPELRIRHGRTLDGNAAGRSGLLARCYYSIFGKAPRVSRLSPYWGALRHLSGIVDAAAARGAVDALIVGLCSGLTGAIVADFSGVQGRVSVPDMRTGNFAKAFSSRPEFDIVVCDLTRAELLEFAQIYAAVRPFVRDGGKIIAFYYRAELTPLPEGALVLGDVPIELDERREYYAGTTASARVLKRYQNMFRGIGLPEVARVAIALLSLVPRSCAASRSEARTNSLAWDPDRPCTSVTVEITVRSATRAPT